MPIVHLSYFNTYPAVMLALISFSAPYNTYIAIALALIVQLAHFNTYPAVR